MTVGLVIVSHSAKLAEGVVELAREMGGEDVAIEAAGGMADPPGAMGTDAELVMGAIERAASDDGVLVLMDLGSALMSAEMAVEMGGGETRVVLAAAPLVEGAVAAAAAARGGLGLDDVAAEARGALRAKVEQLGAEDSAADEADGAERAATAEAEAEGEELRVVVGNRLGLHARPAARFVGAAASADATVEVSNATTGRGPVSARSLTALATLGVKQGHEILVRASGPEAARALDAIRALADANFGDDDGEQPGAPGAAAAGAAADEADTSAAGSDATGSSAAGSGAAAADTPAAPGSVLRGLPVAPGVAIGPAQRLRAPEPAVSDAPAGDPADEHRALDAARDAARADVRAARSPARRGRARRRSSTRTCSSSTTRRCSIPRAARSTRAGATRRRRGRRRSTRWRPPTTAPTTPTSASGPPTSTTSGAGSSVT
jgi:multiphosphoryl transfer protein